MFYKVAYIYMPIIGSVPIFLKNHKSQEVIGSKIPSLKIHFPIVHKNLTLDLQQNRELFNYYNHIVNNKNIIIMNEQIYSLCSHEGICVNWRNWPEKQRDLF